MMDMKKLNTKEWIAVVAAMFVISFFFIFKQNLISILFNNNTSATNVVKQPEVLIQNTLVGSGEIALSGNIVTLNYTGRFVGGKIFDSSDIQGKSLQFVLAVGQVIKGLDEGIVGMRVGGKRTLSIPSELGYGANDYGPIPGGSTLIFDVELLRVQK